MTTERRAPVLRSSTLRTGLRSTSVRLVLLGVLAIIAVLLYLLTDLPRAWEYSLGLRGRTVAGMVIAASAVGVSTVLFQTITANRILTPGIMGFDSVFLAIQVVTAFVIGPAILVAAPPLASWVSSSCSWPAP